MIRNGRRLKKRKPPYNGDPRVGRDGVLFHMRSPAANKNNTRENRERCVSSVFDAVVLGRSTNADIHVIQSAARASHCQLYMESCDCDFNIDILHKICPKEWR